MMLIQKIKNQLNEEKYVKKYLEMLQSTMNRIDNELMQIFKQVNSDGKWSNKELAKYNRKMKLREQIRQELKQYNKSFLATFRNDLADLYKNESLFTQKLLKNELNITKGFDKLPVQAVKSQVVDVIEIKGKTIADYISKYSTDLTFRVEQEIFQSIALGENPRKTTRRLDDIYGTMARNRVDMTTRSWQLAIYNQSNLDTYDQAGLKKVRYLATLDVRTCPICAADHNKVMLIGNAIFLPRHVFCRCAYSPYIDSKLTEPADSYEGWLQDSSRTDEELEQILGNVQNYMKRGLISQKEGSHLEQIIENVLSKKRNLPFKVNDDIINKKILNGINLNDNRQKIAETLLKRSNLNIPVNMIHMKDNTSGYCTFRWSSNNTVRVINYNLDIGDSRPDHYQIKTMFHEFTHARINGGTYDWDKFSLNKWNEIEETVAETVAHYLTRQAGVKEYIVPSYPGYLVQNLPKLKKLNEFKNAVKIEDFGKTLSKYRFMKNNAGWKSLYDKINSVKIDMVKYAKSYEKYVMDNKEEIVNIIFESTGMKDKKIKKHIRESIDDGWDWYDFEEDGFIESLIIAMTKLGVK